MEKDFEKINLRLNNTIRCDMSSMAIANCPDDWNVCSIIASSLFDNKHDFVGLFFK